MEYLGLEPAGTGWSYRSRGLAEGLMLYEQGLNRFGIPRRLATDDDADGWYEVDDTMVDYAEAAFARWEKETKNPEPGVQPRIVDTRVEKAPPPRTPNHDPEEDTPPSSRLVETSLG